MTPAGQVLAALRMPPRIGERVRVFTSDDPLYGVFMERAEYTDGTPAAWIELDDGPLVLAPIHDLTSEGVTV